jgi:hypothetical protein
VEMMIVADLDMAALHRSRAAGSVTPLMDRRTDLFEMKVMLGWVSSVDSYANFALSRPTRQGILGPM